VLAHLPTLHRRAQRFNHTGYFMARHARVGDVGNNPSLVIESDDKIPQASTLMRTSPALGSGTSRSISLKSPWPGHDKSPTLAMAASNLAAGKFPADDGA